MQLSHYDVSGGITLRYLRINRLTYAKDIALLGNGQVVVEQICKKTYWDSAIGLIVYEWWTNCVYDKKLIGEGMSTGTFYERRRTHK